MSRFGLAFFLWLWSTQALALPHPYFSKHPQQAKTLEALLAATELKALEAQPADISIELQDLQGKAYPLRQHRGQVLLLTQWATWCGACKAEMPFKLKLHQALQSDRFATIGISSEDRATVASYAKSAPVMFPTSLVDPQGLMRKFFPGGAIPVTILIDSWGWVVAMKTGGARWDAAPYQKLMRFLISLAPTQAQRQKQAREKAPAPKVSFAQAIKVKAGQTFAVDFALRWVGERDKYTRLLFRLPKQKGLRVLGVSTSGISSEKDANARKYTLRIQAEKPGEYEIDPILLTYWIKDYDNHFQVPIGKISLQVRGLLGTPKKNKGTPQWALILLAVAGALLLLAFAIVLQQKQDASQEPMAEDDAFLVQLEAELQLIVDSYRAQEQREFLEGVRAFRQDFVDKEDPRLNELEEAMRYGGQEPSHHQLSLVVERLFQDLHELYPESSRPLQELL